jgi:hypothetical protein
MKFTFEQPLIQGDVVIKRLKSKPKGLKRSKAKDKILQMSEVTGHHHHFRPDAAVSLYFGPTLVEPGVSTITTNEGKFIEVGEGGAILYHGKGFEDKPSITGRGDHEALHVPPGIYYIDIVREYNYDSMEMVRVVD